MNHWVGTAIFLGFFVISMAIRIPHDKISKATRTAESRKGVREKILLSLMALGSLIFPILSLTPLLSFADYEVHLIAVTVGALLMFAYLWLFHRSHADLGKNWSVTLEIREEHSIVDGGVYRYIRHPMYASIYLMTLGQMLLISNWIAGPASFVAFTLMFAFRLKREEQMMLDRFGTKYEEYRRQTKRLIPGVW